MVARAMQRAIIESRPYLLLSLLLGISYFFVKDSNIPGLYLLTWKGAPIGFLAIYCFRRLMNGDGALIGFAMLLFALGSMVLEVERIAGAVIIIFAYIAAIIFFMRHRRTQTTFSQTALTSIMVPAICFVSWALPADRSDAGPILIFSLFLAIMAAMAWSSKFTRYRVGLGAMLLVAHDLVLFATMGPWEESMIARWLIWPLFYIGLFMISTGVVRRLREDIAKENP